MKPLRVLSLFSGIGAYETALRNLKLRFKVIGFCEKDELTSRCYCIIHNANEALNLKDVSKIVPDELPDFDLLTFSPPCQDISSIGRHAGTSKGTRTGLMWTCLEIIKKKNPSYLVMENVKNLKGRYKNSFMDFMDLIRSMGYSCSANIMEAEQHGLPQMRQRAFMVGIRDDISDMFMWPNPRPLTKFLNDFISPGEPIKSINKKIAYTIRIGGRKSGVKNRHNWDGYIVNGKEYFLSAKDCMRLMGFSDADYNALKDSGISESKILKVAGNSIAVNVIEDIFKSLFVSKNEESLFAGVKNG